MVTHQLLLLVTRALELDICRSWRLTAYQEKLEEQNIVATLLSLLSLAFSPPCPLPFLLSTFLSLLSSHLSLHTHIYNQTLNGFLRLNKLEEIHGCLLKET